VSDRISIPALREEAAALQPDKTRFSAGVVLALVEAVEAAQRLRDATFDPDNLDTLTVDLDVALALFDFGKHT
jgi:hypothetical protein